MTYLKQLFVAVILACALASSLSSRAPSGTQSQAQGRLAPTYDANENGIDDSVDIATGLSLDENLNNVPDEAEVS